jgi:hypothetical protein
MREQHDHGGDDQQQQAESHAYQPQLHRVFAEVAISVVQISKTESLLILSLEKPRCEPFQTPWYKHL